MILSVARLVTCEAESHAVLRPRVRDPIHAGHCDLALPCRLYAMRVACSVEGRWP